MYRRLITFMSVSMILLIAPAHPDAANGESREILVLNSTRVLKSHVLDCFSTRGISPVSLTINGQRLSEEQAQNAAWIKRCVVPLLPGGRAEAAKVAARATWWALREGVLDIPLERVIRYSNCTTGRRDITRSSEPLFSQCRSGIWQVGIAAGQVMNYNEEEIDRAIADIFGRIDSRISPEAILTWTASLAGYAPGSATEFAIRKSKGNLRRSWLLRNPVIGFLLVEELEVNRECFIDRKGWCFGRGYPAEKKFASNYGAMARSVQHLNSYFLQKN